jgi:hypothetical protein
LLVFHLQRRGGEFAAKQGEFFAEQRRDYIAPSRNGDTTAAWIGSALLPAHERYRHNGPSRAATVLPWPSGFSPSYMKFGTGSWRDVIVARRARKSSASFDAPAMVSLRELAGHQKYRTSYVRHFI